MGAVVTYMGSEHVVAYLGYRWLMWVCVHNLQAMSENFVHKQGFLVKQGGKVKNWKKRLFVLNTEGLSYYKTEQVSIIIYPYPYILHIPLSYPYPYTLI